MSNKDINKNTKRPRNATHANCKGCGKNFLVQELYFNVTLQRHTNYCVPCYREAQKLRERKRKAKIKSELAIDNKQITHGIWPIDRAMAEYKRAVGKLPAIIPGTSLRKIQIRTGIL